MLGIPLPYKVGELLYPGNADEKPRTEAATFVCIKDNCPDILIPQLQGFGFPGGQSLWILTGFGVFANLDSL